MRRFETGTCKRVLTLDQFADFSYYFFPIFCTLRTGTSRTDLRTTRPNDLPPRECGEVGQSGNNRAFNRKSANATTRQAADGRRFVPRRVNELGEGNACACVVYWRESPYRIWKRMR